MTGVSATELRVGDASRERAGRAIVAALAVSALYAVCTVGTKETAALYLHQPWQDDPYDVLVSFDFVALPLLVLVAALRIPLCRRFEPLPARRLVDILNACALAVVIGLATQVSEWTAVVTGAHRAQWTVATSWQVAGLAAFTVATVIAGVLLAGARSRLARAARPAAQPDWLADAVGLGAREADRLGPLCAPAQAVLRWADSRVVARARAHPAGAAAAIAVLLSLPEVAAKVILERYPAPLVLFVAAIEVASMFAFIVVAGRLVRVVAPRAERAPAWLCATVVACVAGTLAVAFRDSLLLALGANPARETTATLTMLLFGVGLPVGALVLLVQTGFRWLRASRAR